MIYHSTHLFQKIILVIIIQLDPVCKSSLRWAMQGFLKQWHTITCFLLQLYHCLKKHGMLFFKVWDPWLHSFKFHLQEISCNYHRSIMCRSCVSTISYGTCLLSQIKKRFIYKRVRLGKICPIMVNKNAQWHYLQ